MEAPPPATEPRSITRPDDSLRTYYALVSALALVAFPLAFVPLYIRFRTLRYRFDEDGVAMSWGLLFHRQVHLTYRRIQDIHVTRNVVERWMGLAKVEIQTASGASGATMSIVGIRRPEPLRDFLYERMRGARAEENETDTRDDQALALLRQIRDGLRELRGAASSET